MVLACVSDPTIVLFFPIPQNNANIINEIMKSDELDPDQGVVGIYKTMLDSWKASDRYLSGVILDSAYDDESNEGTLLVRLVLSDNQGAIDSLVKVNCIHSLILSALVGVDIIVDDELLEKVLPEIYGSQDDEEEKESVYPEDKELLRTVAKIMNASIKEEGGRKEEENEEDEDEDEEEPPDVPEN